MAISTAIISPVNVWSISLVLACYRTHGRADQYVGPAINRTSGVRLPLRTVFDAPTIQHLAPRVDDAFGPAVLESMSDEEAERLPDATSADSAL
jgi:hypothetical protein